MTLEKFKIGMTVICKDRHPCPAWVTDMDNYVGKELIVRKTDQTVVFCTFPNEIESGFWFFRNWLDPVYGIPVNYLRKKEQQCRENGMWAGIVGAEVIALIIEEWEGEQT